MSTGSNNSPRVPHEPVVYDDNASFLFPPPPTMKRRPNPLKGSIGSSDSEETKDQDAEKEKGKERDPETSPPLSPKDVTSGDEISRTNSERHIVRSRSYLIRNESRRVLSEGKGGAASVAKKALDDAEQSERAVELIFEELMNQMNMKDDMKVQMRGWDVEKKKTLLLQKRMLHTATKDTTKEDTSKLFFDGCILKVTILGLKEFPRDLAKVVAGISVKEEKVKTPTPWKVPFECEIMCRDLAAVVRIQIHNHTKFGLKEEFLGEIHIPLEAISDDRPHVRWYV
eukprot:Phypoly_transcript_15150.p1 GENE.Phypoly_transcript_15150~~Phypoly_transcript_15150.p1  ORF type:complete len:284 (+),score=51.43 Phypoly_transcript_15150:84-935(+)